MPNWVSNETKYFRAIKNLKAAGDAQPTDEQLKAEYVKYGGLLIEVPVEAKIEKPIKTEKVVEKK